MKHINKAFEKLKHKSEEAGQTILESMLDRGVSIKEATIMAMDLLMAGIETVSLSDYRAIIMVMGDPMDVINTLRLINYETVRTVYHYNHNRYSNGWYGFSKFLGRLVFTK